MKTILHYKTLNLRNPAEKAEYDALNQRLNDAGMGRMRMKVWAAPTHQKGAMEYREAVRSLSGKEVELETEHLFDNQWNTAPIEGLTENGLRVFDWQDASFPDVEHVRQVQWLEQTDEMREVRHNTLKCGYCGKQRARANAPEFCNQCMDSPYLTEDNLFLLRLQPVDSGLHTKRAPLSEEELARMLPRYRDAQLRGLSERAAAAREKRHERILSKHKAAIENADNERAGMLWLLEHMPGAFENAIYYDHIQTFGFGWREKMAPHTAKQLQDELVAGGFPVQWKIECSDGEKLSGPAA